MTKAEFANALKKLANTLTERVSTDDGQWSVKGFIDTFRNVYTISSDTKIVSKILEIHLFPKILAFANEHDFAIVKTINVRKARSKLYQLIDDVYASSEPIQITGKRGNVVLISEDNWKAIQETLYLLSIPGMRESIREGLNTSLEDCSEDLDW